MSINACDIRVSMLLSLLLANIKILPCIFFLSLVMLNNFLTIPMVREKSKVKLALAIPTGAPTTLVNEQIDAPLVLAFKTIKICLCNQKQLHNCLFFYCMIFFD